MAEQVSAAAGTQKTRNILFIEPGQKTARWLLPDNDHIITDCSNITENTESKAKRLIATAVLVKSPASSPEATAGKLLLFDASGRKIVEVASAVREVHLASLSAGDLTILYERDRRLVLATFDPASLGKRAEQVIDVPQPK